MKKIVFAQVRDLQKMKCTRWADRAVTLAFALLSCAVSACASSANTPYEEKRLELANEVTNRAEKTSAPAFVAHSFMARTTGKGDYYAPSIPLKWTVFSGMNILQLQTDTLDELAILGDENIAVIRAVMGAKYLPKERVRLNFTGLSAGILAEQLKKICFVEFRSELTEERLITLSSGPTPIRYKEACELGGWVFAAQGIKLVPDEKDANSVILRLTTEK